VLVTQYTPAAWRSHVAWHTYWRPHAHDTPNEQLRAASPPPPRSDHKKVRLTWGEIRKWVREDAATAACRRAPRAQRATRRAHQVSPPRASPRRDHQHSQHELAAIDDVAEWYEQHQPHRVTDLDAVTSSAAVEDEMFREPAIAWSNGCA